MTVLPQLSAWLRKTALPTIFYHNCDICEWQKKQLAGYSDIREIEYSHRRWARSLAFSGWPAGHRKLSGLACLVGPGPVSRPPVTDRAGPAGPHCRPSDSMAGCIQSGYADSTVHQAGYLHLLRQLL